MAYQATFFQKTKLKSFVRKHIALAAEEPNGSDLQKAYLYIAASATIALDAIERGPLDADKFVRKLDELIERGKTESIIGNL